MKADNNQGDLFKQPISPAPLPCRRERRSLHGDSGQTKSTSLRGGRSPTWQSRRFSNISFSRNGGYSSIYGIAPQAFPSVTTPVCALARNDVHIFGFIEHTKSPQPFPVVGLCFCSYLTAYRAALAFSTRAAKAAESWIAISDRLLRFISMPAFLTPFMNLE